CDIETDPILPAKNVFAFDRQSLAIALLIYRGLGLMEFSISNRNQEISIISQRNLRCAVEGNLNRFRRRSGFDDEVIFKPVLIAVVCGIDPWIHIFGDDFLVGWHVCI